MKNISVALLIVALTGCGGPIHSFYVRSCGSDSPGSHVMANVPNGLDEAVTECLDEKQAQSIADNLNRLVWQDRAAR